MSNRNLIGFCCLGLGWAALANENIVALVLFGAAMALFAEEIIERCK